MFQNIFEIRQRDSAQTRILYSFSMCIATTRMTILITLPSDISRPNIHKLLEVY